MSYLAKVKRSVFITLLLATWTSLSAQGPGRYFNVLPDIGAVDQKSEFFACAVDSHYIYLLGDEIGSVDSTGRPIINMQTTVLDYNGNVVRSDEFVETAFKRPGSLRVHCLG